MTTTTSFTTWPFRSERSTILGWILLNEFPADDRLAKLFLSDLFGSDLEAFVTTVWNRRTIRSYVPTRASV
jgi:hypothetical protein